MRLIASLCLAWFTLLSMLASDGKRLQHTTEEDLVRTLQLYLHAQMIVSIKAGTKGFVLCMKRITYG